MRSESSSTPHIHADISEGRSVASRAPAQPASVISEVQVRAPSPMAAEAEETPEAVPASTDPNCWRSRGSAEIWTGTADGFRESAARRPAQRFAFVLRAAALSSAALRR